ncbi:MAG: ribonuclease III [bacterium]|nr:ribonuclease III [Candidatus Jorgensenbacteria bacterium]
MKKPKDLEEKLNIVFNNQDLLKEALTHRSYLNENQSWGYKNNERLEYLGDAVLELIVTENLFSRFPDFQEGYLTSLRAALVNYQMLGRVAKEITLDKYLYLSKGESKDFGKAREVILANAIEALFGAIYLDRGYDVTRDFVIRILLSHLDEVIEKRLYLDPKSLLQEFVQDKYKLTPTYSVIKEEGPDHQKIFLVGVFIGDKKAAEATGSSKQEAETKSALVALDEFEVKKVSN